MEVKKFNPFVGPVLFLKPKTKPKDKPKPKAKTKPKPKTKLEAKGFSLENKKKLDIFFAEGFY